MVDIHRPSGPSSCYSTNKSTQNISPSHGAPQTKTEVSLDGNDHWQ